MLVGMGAGLLLARPACAPQEMDPEFFDVYANTTVMDQASHRTPGAEAVKVAAADLPAPLAAQGVDAEGLTAVDTSVMVILIIGIGSTVLFGMAEAVSANLAVGNHAGPAADGADRAEETLGRFAFKVRSPCGSRHRSNAALSRSPRHSSCGRSANIPCRPSPQNLASIQKSRRGSGRCDVTHRP